MATSVIDYVFRELAINYLERYELAHVKPEDLPEKVEQLEFDYEEEELISTKLLAPSSIQNKKGKDKLNFGGQNTELWCEGGEVRFVKTMVDQSLMYASQCLWFTALVSKSENLNAVYEALERVKAIEVKIIEMSH